MAQREADEFLRIQLRVELDRIEGLIATYQEHMDDYHHRARDQHFELGRVAERLGRPYTGNEAA